MLETAKSVLKTAIILSISATSLASLLIGQD